MRKLEIRDYYTGKAKYVKLNSKACDCSIDYRVEDDKIIIRDHYSQKILQRVKAPEYSFQMNIVDF
jgi:hypothetical protein